MTLKGQILINKSMSGMNINQLEDMLTTRLNMVLKDIHQDRLKEVYMNNEKDILVVWDEDAKVEI